MKRFLFILITSLSILIGSQTGCGTIKEDPTETPVPPPIVAKTPTPIATTAATVLAIRERFEPIPTPDTQVLTSDSSEDPEPYRVIILLDNSITPMTLCPEVAETPDNSRARRLMKETTVFLVNLLAAVNGPTNPEARIGVYSLFGRDQGGSLESMTLAQLRPAAEYEGDPEWSAELEKALSEAGVNEGGYDTAIKLLRAGKILGEDAKQIIILITDGFTGDYSDFDANMKRENFKDELEALALQENETTFIVFRLECPGMENNETNLGRMYKADKLHWDAWSGLHLIEHITVPLPESLTASSSNMMSLIAARPYVPKIIQLLSLDPFKDLMPRLSPGDGTYGWEWKQEGDADGSLHQIPGDTGVFRLWVVLSSDVPGASYDLVVSREAEPFSVAAKNGAFPGTFQIDELDIALANILEEPTDACGSIDWYVSGDKRLAFYWWDSTPISYEFDLVKTQILPTVITNNGPITVEVDVNPIGPTGHRDCYGVRASLFSTRENESLLLAQDHVLLSEMNRDMQFTFIFDGYNFDPQTDGDLKVTLELSHEFDKKMDTVTREMVAPTPTQVDIWSQSIPVVYQPQLTNIGGNCDDDGCSVEMEFRYAGLHYHDSHPPQPRLYALSTFEPDDLDTPTCRGYRHTRPSHIFFQGNEDDSFQSIMSIGRADNANLEPDDPAWILKVVNSELSQMNLRQPFPRAIITDCGYAGILLQWPDHPNWPAVYCAFVENGVPACDAESDMRIRQGQ